MKYLPQISWRIFLTTTIALTISNLAFAQNVIELNKGSPAPYNGYLFTPAETLKLKNTSQERDGFKLLNDSLTSSLNTSTEMVTELKTENNDLLTHNNQLSTDLQSARSTSEFTKVVWFALGIFATGFAVYGAKQLTK